MRTRQRSQRDRLLPSNFTIFVGDDGAANVEYPGATAKILPTVNHERGRGGGYLVVYTHTAAAAVYAVGADIFMAGQLRVQGRYYGRIFYPAGSRPGDDISQRLDLKALAARYFPQLGADLWLGGDSGGWLGRA